MSPQRVQRKRTKGWRMPENTVYVGRGSRWGSPYKVGEAQLRFPRVDGTESWEFEGRLHKRSGEQHTFHHSDHTRAADGTIQYRVTWHDVRDATAEECVALYRENVTGQPDMLDYRHKNRVDEIRAELAGKDLACWCPLDKPCHADVLLELANAEVPA
ncbi:DUF4326 domain-containing protein [Paenarthrobacter ureafaciens]